MKWNDTFILLLCGTIMGGVFVPIFMTDILGYRRMIEWFPEGLSFDWGSFLGGSIAGVAAFGVFMIQRRSDRKDSRRTLLANLVVISVGARENLIALRNGKAYPKTEDVPARVAGFGGMLEALKVSIRDWEDPTDKQLSKMRERANLAAVIADSNLERLWLRLDRAIISSYMPKRVTEGLVGIEISREKIRSSLIALLGDTSLERWEAKSLHAKKGVIQRVIVFDKRLKKLILQLRVLQKECERG